MKGVVDKKLFDDRNPIFPKIGFLIPIGIQYQEYQSYLPAPQQYDKPSPNYSNALNARQYSINSPYLQQVKPPRRYHEY